jgi:hypothetical protein
MKAFLREHLAVIGLIASGMFAAAAGFLASQAFSAASQAAVTTTTVTLQNGATGPTGPAGPAGPPASAACPAGYVEGDVVVVHQGGPPLTIRTCVKT